MKQHRNYTTLSGIASGLDKVKWCGNNRFVACCPAHDDRTPSFTANDVNGKILVKCFAGCTQEEVIGALRDLGLWHTASRYQLDKQKHRKLEKKIRFHRTILALGSNLSDQGIELSELDQTQMNKSIQFLKDHADE